jgi:YD repeat-containing protein
MWDARGTRLTYLYDSGGRPSGERYSTGRRVTFLLDAAGNRTVLWDDTGRTSWTYDAKNRTVQLVNPEGRQHHKRIHLLHRAVW